MAIDFDRFLTWAENRLGDAIVKGNEIRLNSFFAEDHKHHMWCNPLGGKKNVQNGVFQCWKTGMKGSLVSLVMQVDNCTFEEALEILGGADLRLEILEKQVEEMFENKSKVEKKEEEKPSEKLELPPFTYFFDDLPSSSYHRVKAEVYLHQRKISSEGLAICTGGAYKNRIIIPYYDREGKLIYFNGRHIGESTLRYMGPPKECGIGKGDVLYFPEWPEKGSKIYLAEGEFDCKSIKMCGLPTGAFGGKSLTDTQINIIRSNNFSPILCLDSDEAGKFGLRKMGKQLILSGFDSVGFVRPPEQYKDWNAFLQALGRKIMRRYIEEKTKFYGGSHGLIDGGWTNIQLGLMDI